MPARSIDTATISFGLVSIPVKIYSTTEPSHELHFHMVHEGCGERLKQQYICPEHGAVERDQIVKGFELSKGNIIEFDKAELKALDAVASDEISLAEFVPISAVDPLFVDRSYYLGPGKGGDRAYRLFRDALEDAELSGIATYAARGKQYVVMIRPFEDGLVMHQLRYPDEVKPWSEVPLGRLAKPAAAELTLASKVIDGLRHDTFDPAQYKDEVKERVRKLIAKKAKTGEVVVAPEHDERPEMTDLMAALKASLGGSSAEHHRKPARKARAHAHTTTRRTRQRPQVRARTSARAKRAHR